MAVKRWAFDDAVVRQVAAGAPRASVVLGAEAGLGIGVVETRLAPGEVMPEHGHGASEVAVIVLSGHGQIVSVADGAVTELDPEAVVTIPTGERVRVENPGDEEVRMLVVLTPPDFTKVVGGWEPAEHAARAGRAA